MHKYPFFVITLGGMFFLWTYIGITQTGVHVDLARDLNEISNIWLHRIVWLGPMTSANFPTSPIYYYLLSPFLFLSGGNGLSVIISHSFFAILALGTFVYFQSKQSVISAVLVTLTIGLSPWWIQASSLPWNGHMYVAWAFLGLATLYFKTRIFLPALLFGISIAINPVAIFATPVLFYEWLSREERLKNLIFIILGLTLPWLPILIFEIITAGFLTRQWLNYPSTAGLALTYNFSNIYRLLNIVQITQPAATAFLLAAFFIGSRRDKWWIVFITLPLLFLISVSQLRQYYLLGLVTALSFTVFTILSKKIFGKVILILLILTFVQTINIPPFSFPKRSIPNLENTVSQFIQKTNLNPDKKYAVVSVIDKQNSSPQADDYRFFLRMKGFNALGIDDYPQADILLLFVEVPNFDYKQFEDWHTQRFGSRKFISSQNIEGTIVITYNRD